MKSTMCCEKKKVSQCEIRGSHSAQNMVHSLEPILREKRLENWMLLFLGVSGDTIHNVGFLQFQNL